MLDPKFINVGHRELQDFDTLCGIIRENSVQRLVLSFYAFMSFGDKLDAAVADKDVVYKLTAPPTEIINAAMTQLKISVVEVNWAPTKPSFYNWIAELKNNLDDYVFVYNLLEDELSKKTFYGVLLCRLLCSFSYLDGTYRPLQYFDPEVMPRRDDAVYVDCGAYDGDSALSFIKNYGDGYKKIFAYEPTPTTFAKAKRNLAAYRDIVLRNAGVGERKGQLRFHSKLEVGNFIDYDNLGFGDLAVPIVALDQDIKEPVSFIKMDIEGSELFALKGAAEHIVNDKPQLAICTYHLMEDLRTIPHMIYSLNKNQRFHFRGHQEGFSGELVFYADPIL